MNGIRPEDWPAASQLCGKRRTSDSHAPTVGRSIPRSDLAAVMNHMVNTRILTDDNGLLWIGESGEEEYGYRHFMEVLSSFTAPPLFRVEHGKREIGMVDQISFLVRQDGLPVLLLGGRNWQVTHLDWNARVAYVVPTEAKGRSQWISGGPPLSFVLCQAIREVACTDTSLRLWSTRATEAIQQIRAEMPWCQAGKTALVSAGSGLTRWWTFGGFKANVCLAAAGYKAVADNLYIVISTDIGDLDEVIPQQLGASETMDWPASQLADAVDALKFSVCLPPELAANQVRLRLGDVRALRSVLTEIIVRG